MKLSPLPCPIICLKYLWIGSNFWLIIVMKKNPVFKRDIPFVMIMTLVLQVRDKYIFRLSNYDMTI
jgi:hypothetical protein